MKRHMTVIERHLWQIESLQLNWTRIDSRSFSNACAINSRSSFGSLKKCHRSFAQRINLNVKVIWWEFKWMTAVPKMICTDVLRHFRLTCVGGEWNAEAKKESRRKWWHVKNDWNERGENVARYSKLCVQLKVRSNFVDNPKKKNIETAEYLSTCWPTDRVQEERSLCQGRRTDRMLVDICRLFSLRRRNDQG